MKRPSHSAMRMVFASSLPVVVNNRARMLKNVGGGGTSLLSVSYNTYLPANTDAGAWRGQGSSANAPAFLFSPALPLRSCKRISLYDLLTRLSPRATGHSVSPKDGT